jgi:hypothetical protein
MVQFKGTPGPWSVGDDDEGADGVAYIEVYAGAYGDASFRSIAHVQANFLDDKFQPICDGDFANARLIEAAPDMLEALQAASGLLADIYPDGLVKEKVDAAIAKATGAA